MLIAAPVLWATWRRHPLTTLLYGLIALHLGRNPYDKIGHFIQGLVPAVVAREVLLQGGAFIGVRGDGDQRGL